VTNSKTSQKKPAFGTDITHITRLEQNIPNPFNNITVINYTLPQKFTTAKIIISDGDGKILKQVSVPAPGKGTLKINAATLPPGVYKYALIIDGRRISSKGMVLIK
jgi:hypothetical protein